MKVTGCPSKTIKHGRSLKLNDILLVLKLSYNHLPIHLKQCFTYCSLFPKGYEIAKEVLIQLWMAQGYIQSLDRSLQLEFVADQYFKELLSRSFFQEVEKDRYDNIVRCKMHDLIHDLAQSVAIAECTANHDLENISERVYHCSFEILSSWPKKFPKALLKCKRIRTMLFLDFSTRGRSISKAISFQDTVMSNFRSLRVLDLHGWNTQFVPDCVGKLSHLRYLDLSYHQMHELPNSLCNLQNLQTLKLVYCKNLKELPRDIVNLTSLRYLIINGCGFDAHAI